MFQDSDIEDLFRRTLHLECDEPLRQVESELKQLDEELGRLGVDGSDPSSQQPSSSTSAAGTNDAELSREAAIEDLETFVIILDQVVAKTESEQAPEASAERMNSRATATTATTAPRTDLLSAFLGLYCGTLRHRFAHVLAEFSEAREAVVRLALRLLQIGESSGTTTQSAGDLLLFALGGRDARGQIPSAATAERLLYSALLPRWFATWTETAEGQSQATLAAVDLSEVDPTVLQYLFWNDLRWQKKLLDIVVRSVERESTKPEGDAAGESSTTSTASATMTALSAIVSCSMGLPTEEVELHQWIPPAWRAHGRIHKLKRLFVFSDYVHELSTILTENVFPSLVSISRRLMRSRAITARDYMTKVYRPLTEQLRSIAVSIDRELQRSTAETTELEALRRFPQLLASGLYRLLLCCEEQQKINTGQPVKRNRVLDPGVGAGSAREKNATTKSATEIGASPTAAPSSSSTARNALGQGPKISLEDIEVIALQHGLIVRPTNQPSTTGQPVHLVLRAADSSNVDFALPISYFYVDHVSHTVMFKLNRRDAFQKMDSLQQIFTPKSG